MASEIAGLITELRLLLARRGAGEDPAVATLAARTLELAVLGQEQGNEIEGLHARLELRSR